MNDYIIVVLIIFILVLIGLLFLWIFLMKQWNYKVRIRETTKTGVRLIYDTLAKVGKDKEGKIDVLILQKPPLKEYKYAPIPPSEAIDYDSRKKKKIVEAWFSNEEGYTYIADQDKVEGFQPLTTKQRSILVGQTVKAHARKSTKWQENIPLIAGLSTLVLIILVVLLFWGEAMQPMMTLGDQISELVNRVDIVCSGTNEVPMVTPP